MENGETILIISKGNSYPRNQTLVKALTEVFSIETSTSKLSSLWRTKAKKIFFLWPANHLAFSILIAKIFGKRVIFDAFTSMYDSLVDDRRTVKRGSIRSFYLYIQDYLCCHLADVLVFDTQGHKDYFFKAFKIKPNKTCVILPVTVDLDWIDQQPPREMSKEKTEILFYGSFIPLQGIETILQSVNLTKDLPVHFSIIGKGQTYSQMLELAKNLHIQDRVTFIQPTTYAEIVGYIKSADLCLGIFGVTEKAQRVIPNKVLECAACGKPTITGINPDMAKFFKDKESIFFCPMGDPKALSEAIRWAFTHQDESRDIGQAGRSVIQANFSLPVLTDKIRKGL